MLLVAGPLSCKRETMFKYITLLLVLLCSCTSDVVEERHRPAATGADQVQQQQVLVEWDPKGLYVGVEAQGIACDWYSDGSDGDDLDGGFGIKDLDTRRPYIWHNNSIMACTPLLEYTDAWHLQCQQRVTVQFIGLHRALLGLWRLSCL